MEKRILEPNNTVAFRNQKWPSDDSQQGQKALKPIDTRFGSANNLNEQETKTPLKPQERTTTLLMP